MLWVIISFSLQPASAKCVHNCIDVCTKSPAHEQNLIKSAYTQVESLGTFWQHTIFNCSWIKSAIQWLLFNHQVNHTFASGGLPLVHVVVCILQVQRGVGGCHLKEQHRRHAAEMSSHLLPLCGSGSSSFTGQNYFPAKPGPAETLSQV